MLYATVLLRLTLLAGVHVWQGDAAANATLLGIELGHCSDVSASGWSWATGKRPGELRARYVHFPVKSTNHSNAFQPQFDGYNL